MKVLPGLTLAAFLVLVSSVGGGFAGWNLRGSYDTAVNTVKPAIEAAQSVQAVKENPIGFLFPAKEGEGK